MKHAILLARPYSDRGRGSRAAAFVRRTGHLSRRRDDRVRQRRRHLGSAGARRRRAPAGVASGHRIAAAVLARRQAPRLHLDAHRRRRRLRPDARHRRSRAADVRRCGGAGDRLVARRRSGSTSRRTATSCRDVRCLSRARRRRHADAGGGGSLHHRVLRRAVAGAATSSRSPRAPTPARSGGATATATSTRARSGSSGPAASAPSYEPVTKGGAKDAWPMWSARRQDAVLHVRPQRRAEHLVASAVAVRAPAAPGAAKARHDLQGRPRAVAVDLAGRQDDRVRARLRHLDGRYGHRPGARSADRAARRAGGGRRSSIATFTDQIQELALSPDGKKVAFTVHGEIFSASAKDGGDAARVTTTAGEEAELAWSPDSRRLVVHVRPRPARTICSSTTSATGSETQLTSGSARDDHAAVFARRQVDRVRARFARAARHRSGDEGREAGRHRRVRHAAVRRPARLRLVARLAVHRLSDRRARRRFTNVDVAPVATGTPSRPAPGRSASSRTPTRARWRGAPTARI